ncbi:hypothetical protein LINGRAHAP2_LOCUS17247 [Linum grandiflorum]
MSTDSARCSANSDREEKRQARLQENRTNLATLMLMQLLKNLPTEETRSKKKLSDPPIFPL